MNFPDYWMEWVSEVVDEPAMGELWREIAQMREVNLMLLCGGGVINAL